MSRKSLERWIDENQTRRNRQLKKRSFDADKRRLAPGVVPQPHLANLLSLPPGLSPLSSRRQLKAAEAIREVVASAIVTEIRDPRVQGVTVVGVKVTADMREAKVLVSVMGDEKQENLSLHGLKNSAGFLQQRIAQRIDTKNTPRLSFEVDKGLQNTMTVNEILERIRREKEAESAPSSDAPSSDDPSSDDSPGGQPSGGQSSGDNPSGDQDDASQPDRTPTP